MINPVHSSHSYIFYLLHSFFSLQSTDTGSAPVPLLWQEEKISHLSCEQSPPSTWAYLSHFPSHG